ncbi:hypothetical protein SEA_ROARY_80 [Mycobacterium phage Roary]|nr:hypothetical protein SEA_ROARY_80 [Mycobacterium phage Roary]
MSYNNVIPGWLLLEMLEREKASNDDAREGGDGGRTVSVRPDRLLRGMEPDRLGG